MVNNCESRKNNIASHYLMRKLSDGRNRDEMTVAEDAEWIAGRASNVKINNIMLNAVMDKVKLLIICEIRYIFF